MLDIEYGISGERLGILFFEPKIWFSCSITDVAWQVVVVAGDNHAGLRSS